MLFAIDIPGFTPSFPAWADADLMRPLFSRLSQFEGRGTTGEFQLQHAVFSGYGGKITGKRDLKPLIAPEQYEICFQKCAAGECSFA